MPDGRRRRVEIARVGPRQHFSSCYQEAAKTGGGGPAQQTQTRTAAFGSISWKTNVIAAGAVAPFTVVSVQHSPCSKHGLSSSTVALITSGSC